MKRRLLLMLAAMLPLAALAHAKPYSKSQLEGAAKINYDLVPKPDTPFNKLRDNANEEGVGASLLIRHVGVTYDDSEPKYPQRRYVVNVVSDGKGPAVVKFSEFYIGQEDIAPLADALDKVPATKKEVMATKLKLPPKVWRSVPREEKRLSAGRFEIVVDNRDKFDEIQAIWIKEQKTVLGDDGNVKSRYEFQSFAFGDPQEGPQIAKLLREAADVCQLIDRNFKPQQWK